jgi:hypothetical protein
VIAASLQASAIAVRIAALRWVGVTPSTVW